MKKKLHLLRVFIAQNRACCPLLLPWFPCRRYEDSYSKLRRLLAREEWKEWGFWGKTGLLLLSVLWPLTAFVETLKLLHKRGAITKRLTGVSRMKQLERCLKLCSFFGFAPMDFYEHRRFIEGDFSEAPYSAPDSTLISLHRRMNRGLDTSVLDDKFFFYKFFSSRGLSVIPVYAYASGGRIEWHNRSLKGRLPHCDVFFKPNDYYQGKLTEVWKTVEGREGVWKRDDRELNEKEIVERLATLSADKHGFLLQKRIRNSAQLQTISANALSTVRVVTYRFPGQKPQVLAPAKIALSIGERHLDQQALSAGVNTETGELTPALIDAPSPELYSLIQKFPLKKEWDFHPETGSPISGLRIEGWQDMVRLCIQAHSLIDHLPFVAWDVAMTEEGAMLVEGNSGWGFGRTEASSGIPLGKTAFADCYLANYKHRFPDNPEVQ